jgi:hypothetical protein
MEMEGGFGNGAKAEIKATSDILVDILAMMKFQKAYFTKKK